MARKTNFTPWVIIAIIGIAGYFMWSNGVFEGKALPSPSGGSGKDSVGYATTISVSAINKTDGLNVLDANAYIDSSDWSLKNTAVSSATTSLSTSAPNTMSGKLYIGNDNGQGTDRGTEYYYREIPFSYSGKGSVQLQDTDGSTNIKMYPEATSLTWSGYDQGTLEATTNITVGTSVSQDAEAKMTVASKTYFGSPDVANPIGVCFNASDLTVFNEIRPANYAGTFATPEVLKGKNVIGCYILPTQALGDDGQRDTEYRFTIRIDPASNPGVTDYIGIIPIDKVWSQDDNQNWRLDWTDNSKTGTDVDPGLNYIGNEKIIWMN